MNAELIRVALRDTVKSDLETFFEQQLDPEANRMTAFTSKNPYDRRAFDAHWAQIFADARIVIKTILANDRLAGYILHHPWFGEPEVTYWLGRDFWGKGIASAALAEFVRHEKIRPLYGRVARDNIASRRVLENSGFVRFGEDRGFSNARGEEVEELIYVLRH